MLAASIVVLLGWGLDIVPAKTLLLSNVTMKVNTAAGLGLSAIWLLLQALGFNRSPAQKAMPVAVALAVLTIGLVTLVEYALGINPGFDQILLSAESESTLSATPGRMAAVTAFLFSLIGLAMITSPVRLEFGVRIASPLFLTTGALSLTALLGYVYGVIPTAGIGQGIQIAIPTSIALILLCAGSLALPPYGPWLATLLSDQAGGMLARRLLPFAFFVPFALGALRQAEEWTGIYSTATNSAISAVLTMLSFGVVIWWTATLLDAADRRRVRSEGERMALALKEQTARAGVEAERASRFAAESAREQAERAAKEKAEALTVLEIVLSSAPVGFALFGRDGRYIRVNSTFACMYDFLPEDYIGHLPADASPDGAESITKFVDQVLATGEPVLGVEVRKPASPDATALGAERHLLASYYPLRGGSESVPFAVGLIAVETTERRQLEAQLAQSQKMEAIGQLAGGIAHDFNNLLTVIMSYSSLLLGDLDARDPRRDDVEEITAAARRASALTRQLLTFSRKEVLQPRAVNLNEVIQGVEKMLHRLIGEDISLETTLQPDLGQTIIDPGQLEQVLLNLALNARDAMTSGGSLRVSTSITELTSDSSARYLKAPAGQYVVLIVSDTGSGMSPEVQRRIFEPFFTTKEVGKGTGLGLSTVYGIIKQAGGDLALTSTPGIGTTFEIYLPRALDIHQNESEDAQTDQTSSVTGTILLAEDDHPLRALAERVLGSAGFTVLPARNGSHAIEIAREYTGVIDLFATDVVMPGLSGAQLVKEVRSLRPGIRILLMSGYTDDEIMKRGVLEGGTPFLQKPFEPAQLIEKIREVMRNGSTLA